MKEAAGEANLTVVAIILIGVIVAVVTPLINNLMSNTAERACCTDAGGVWSGGECDTSYGMQQLIQIVLKNQILQLTQIKFDSLL